MFAPVFDGPSEAGTSSFTRKDTDGILVSRILHQRMLPDQRAIDDDEVGN
jgi:hypothetical protein